MFPGVGLAAIVAEAVELPESTFLVAARRLAALATDDDLAAGLLFPPIRDLRAVAREVAVAVVEHLGAAGVGRRFGPGEAPAAIDAAMWEPRYVPYEAA